MLFDRWSRKKARKLRPMQAEKHSELLLGDAGAHDARRRCAPRDDVSHLIYDFRAAPLLVRQGLYLVLPLLALDELHVSSSSTLGVVPGEEIDAQRIAVETRQGDELPAEAQLGEVPDERLHLSISHASRVPVERRAEVVGQHLVWHCSANLLRELRGLAEDGLARLHPDAVGVRSPSDGTLDAELGGALDAEVALH